MNSFDRVAIGRQNDRIDGYSFATQYGAGYLAVGIPAAWTIARTVLRLTSPTMALAEFGIDFLVLAEATLWNGVSMEVVRLTVQRPRPFVFQDPKLFGANPAHYTSFYSGHTSFAALASTSSFLALAGRGAPALALTATSLVGLVMVILTGTFRVAAGRHYPTDTIAGAVAGLMIAGLVAWAHRRRRQPPEQI